MKSRSYNISEPPMDKVKHNKTMDFVNFYKSAAETSVKLVEKRKSDEGSSKQNVTPSKSQTPKLQSSPNKIKKKLPSEKIDVTSTPVLVKKDTIVKSVIYTNSLRNKSLHVTNDSTSSNKPKKRNKSVSFMLDDVEVVAMKRSKSEEMVSKSDDKFTSKTKKHKKSKKKPQDEKENTVGVNSKVFDNAPVDSTASSNLSNMSECLPTTSQTNERPERKKHNKHQKAKSGSAALETEKDENENGKIKENKRHHIKSGDTVNIHTEEPTVKSSKKDTRPDKITQDLENLSIGDNAHTLTDLLDEMSVIDENKKKQQKCKQKKDKYKQNTETAANSERETMEQKEKVKWNKRKWNKDKKGGMNIEKHLTSVIIENIPLKIMFNYRKLLTEHFQKFGMIKQVGIAEVYSTEDGDPNSVFATTINFYSEDAANMALEEDNSLFEGACIRVKRVLSPALTTVVVHSYADLTEQALSSVLSGAGRIRSIRHLIKGRKSLSTVFVEFGDQESVQRAIDVAYNARVEGKRIHVTKYKIRGANKKMKKDKPQDENAESDSN